MKKVDRDVPPKLFKVRLKKGADSDEVKARTGVSVWFADVWDHAKSINTFNVGVPVARSLMEDPDVETDIDGVKPVRDIRDKQPAIVDPPTDPGDGA